MKRICMTAALALMLSLCCAPSGYAAPSKQQKRAAYTLKNLKLDAKTQKALLPVIMEYLAELKAAQKPYDDLKDKYKTDLERGVITDKVADALLAAKWKCAKAETVVKEKYEKRFRAILSPKKVWYCFDLLNDKMSKIDGATDSDAK